MKKFQKKNTTGSRTITLYEGTQTCNSLNSSFNHVFETSGISFESSEFSYASFCTFVNNTADHVCIRYQTSSFFTEFKMLSIFGNQSPNFGIIYCLSSISFFYDSLFTQNSQLNKLFCSDASQIKIINGLIFHHLSHLSVLSNAGVVSYGVNVYRTSSTAFDLTFEIKHFQTYLCEADIPITNELSSNITLQQTPYRTYDEFVNFSNSYFPEFNYIMTIFSLIVL